MTAPARRGAWTGAAVLGGCLSALLVAERRRPRRARAEPGGRRIARNLAIAMTAGLSIAFIERPLVARAQQWTQAHRWGLCARALPSWLQTALGLLWLDYTLYIWHVMTHRVPLLWRFHRVHHADLDLDVTTALRFHLGEMACSAPFRALQVLAIGLPPSTLALYQRVLLISIWFHHANLRLPPRIEAVASRVLMTPGLHEIHHDADASVRDCNWSSGLVLWDRLHGTWHTEAPLRPPRIGTAERREVAQLTLGKMLAAPWTSPLPGR